jgi:prephenate dehydrogenase
MKKSKVINVAIIGVGLIGGSLGMALRKAKGYRVTGIGRDKKKLALARRLGAVDTYFTDMADGVREADIVVVCTPVDHIVPAVRSILPYLKPHAVITDVGGVKKIITSEVDALLRHQPRETRPTFIGGHPMAGSEKTGAQFADADLFKGATVVLMLPRPTSLKAAYLVAKLWKDAGAKIEPMTPEKHDRLVAYTSHLPHLLSFSLCNTVPRRKEAARLVAGSFKDMTRVADSDPESWAAICSGNRKELKQALDKFIFQLKVTAKYLEKPEKLRPTFTNARAIRKILIRTRRK